FLVCPFMSMATFSISYLIKNHEMLIEDIEKGTVDPSVELNEQVRKKIEANIKPDPKRATELREAFSKTNKRPLISAIWPDISYIVGIGSADFEPFTKTLCEFLDDDVTINYSLYACSESLIGFSIYPNEPKYLPIIDLAFYEFIPVDSDDREKTLLLNELEEGKLYEIIITTKGGFYRYQLKDVIQVVGFEGETPLIEFAYRANFVTDLCGTHITGYHLAESIRDLEKNYGLHVVDYCIYPNTDFDNTHIELFVELDRAVSKEEMKKMEASFDEYLCHYAWDYNDAVRMDLIDPVELHVVKKDAFNDYRSSQLSKGASSNQLKAMRLIDTDGKLQYFKNNLI
ncbi:MAG: GH3 auxin-responsive promoter family protein, partial [Erysipelotrichaceae bacterium]|nr:GH3 auxin-responsive promoter family protein [Erysipelotrichaceae bacterium]